MSEFQGHAKRSGIEFEDFVERELSSIGVVTDKDFYMEGSGCEADFVATIDGVEEYIECKGGNGKIPGAQRTDSVKKAIANGILMKFTDPSIRYVVYFSGKPKPGSYSEEMIRTALDNNIIDEIRYRENYV